MSIAIPIIYYNELNQNTINKKYERVIQQLQTGDFTGAEVKKMVNSRYYRARLDEKDRLLFTWVEYKGKKHLLLLELIINHEYQKSRFLRCGIIPDESQWLPLSNTSIPETPIIITYLNEKDKQIHALNKFISFDADQVNIYKHQPPMVLIGSAGSGKTVLVLEKIKLLGGRVLYTSLSKYLVDNARQLYFANGYENEEQEIDFLSFSQYMNTWQKPGSKEIKFLQFNGWFLRNAQTLKFTDAHKLFEEFNGVITGQATESEYFSLEQYLELGIRQSVYLEDERKIVYQMFKKYLEWMNEDGYYDSNMLSHRYLDKVQPIYDYIVIDEVQDITNAQLQFILRSLVSKNGFIITGDSNQIVHPNFFSWAAIKAFFFKGNATTLPIHILHTNYRNSQKVVQLSNRLLAIKNQRFGSIDKESNYLIKTNSIQNGEVLLLQVNDKTLKDLNQRTFQSAGYAVIVPTDQDKIEVAKIFKTPLLFSVHEAKGLEYENVILVNFISKNSKEFNVIADGLDVADLDVDSLNYARPANKADKEGEVYKFYVNSLYVALTRALSNIYILEQQPNHYALQLLGLVEYKAPVNIQSRQSTKEEWLDEADKLEAQGKIEQAEQIRAKILGYEYINPEELEKVKLLALDPTKKENEVKRERKLLYSYAANNNHIDIVEQLATLQFQRAILHMKEIRQARKEYSKNCRLGRVADMLPIIKKYGADFIAEDDGATGIMIALHYNQGLAAQKLVELKANLHVCDKKQWTAFHYMLNGYLNNAIRKQTNLTNAKLLIQFWHIAKPDAIKITTNGQLKNLPGHRLYTLIFLLVQCFDKELAQMQELKNKELLEKLRKQLVDTQKTVKTVTNKLNNVPQMSLEDVAMHFGLNVLRTPNDILVIKRVELKNELEEELKNQQETEEQLLNEINDLSEPHNTHFSTEIILSLVACLPTEIFPDEKKKRTTISSILAGQESGSTNPYSKALFKRIDRGVYIIEPGLQLVV